MKKVIKVSFNGEFHQYIMLSEIRLVNQWLRLGKKVELNLVEISIAEYKTSFGINY